MSNLKLSQQPYLGQPPANHKQQFMLYSYYNMQLDSEDRQNLDSPPANHHDDNLECSEILSLPLTYHSDNRVKSCGCRCTCLRESHQEDALEKRRLKRKQSKRRQKERQKQFREKSLLNLQTIIRNIYSLKSTFKQCESQIKNCLVIESSRDRLCEFINMVIREQIDLIRREIVQAIANVDHLPPGQEHTAIPAVFYPIQKIAVASLEVEQLINLFVASYSEDDEEEAPMQRNLDRTTLKFLVKTDLYRTGNFNRLCSYIFQAPPELYLREKELIKLMMSSFDHSLENSTHLGSSESEEDTQEYIDYEDEEWEEEGSTVESVKSSANERSRRRRKERRRKLRQDFESSFESIIKRMEQITVVQQERNVCNVSEEWIERIRKRRYGLGVVKQ